MSFYRSDHGQQWGSSTSAALGTVLQAAKRVLLATLRALGGFSVFAVSAVAETTPWWNSDLSNQTNGRPLSLLAKHVQQAMAGGADSVALCTRASIACMLSIYIRQRSLRCSLQRPCNVNVRAWQAVRRPVKRQLSDRRSPGSRLGSGSMYHRMWQIRQAGHQSIRHSISSASKHARTPAGQPGGARAYQLAGGVERRDERVFERGGGRRGGAAEGSGGQRRQEAGGRRRADVRGLRARLNTLAWCLAVECVAAAAAAGAQDEEGRRHLRRPKPPSPFPRLRSPPPAVLKYFLLPPSAAPARTIAAPTSPTPVPVPVPVPARGILTSPSPSPPPPIAPVPAPARKPPGHYLRCGSTARRAQL
ncbi:hypothetical protein BDZ91DRAFT_783337 [Kalaharituber pfeilii]|nr:hypothetical protein BDZ91DRAFT_783337 [Kalaharituber pfeilii]